MHPTRETPDRSTPQSCTEGVAGVLGNAGLSRADYLGLDEFS